MSPVSTDDFESIRDDENVEGLSYEKREGVLRVFVTEKLPESELADDRIISNRVSNQETDVVEVGEIWAGDVYDPDVADVDAEEEATSRHRPAEAGRSEIRVGSSAATAGLLAEVVAFDRVALWHKDVDEGDRVRVSNAHVYGDMEEDLGMNVTQPSGYDGGQNPEDVVGQTVGVVRIGDEVVDAAVRTTSDDESYDVRGLGQLDGVYRGPAEDLRGERVCKSGRTTGVTDGAVLGTDATVRVRYDSSTTITKRHQILTEDMSRGGDSGSPLVRGHPSDPGALVGHIFAGSDKVSVANRASLIEERLGVEFTVSDSQEHEPETHVEDLMEERLIDEYGEENVLRQHRFPDGRYADLLAFADGFMWALELENDAYSVLNGSGQCAHYAFKAMEEWPDRGVAIPVLCVPEGHIDPEERRTTELRGIRVWEVDAPEEVSWEGV